MKTKAGYILIFSYTIWSSASGYYHKHDYMTDNLPYESAAMTVGNESPGEVTFSQPEVKKGEAQWPPKPYFVVNRYIKQTLMPSIRKLPSDSVQNIATVSGIKVLEAASENSSEGLEKSEPEVKYSLPVSPKYDSNDWQPMHFARGVNRYSMPHKLPGLLDRHYPLPVSDDYAEQLPTPQPHHHSRLGESQNPSHHLQLTPEAQEALQEALPQYPRLPSLPSTLPQAAEEILPLQETYKGAFRTPEVYLEKMEHKDTPMKYIEKVIYRQIPTTIREMPMGSGEEEVGEEVSAHQYQQHHQIKQQPHHHNLPKYHHNMNNRMFHQINHELPVHQMHLPQRTSGHHIPYGLPEPEEGSEEAMGERAPVMFKLPFPKPPKFRKVSADSIGALYSKLTCQQYRDPKAQGEELEYESENGNREVNYIYMFKNRLPH